MNYNEIPVPTNYRYLSQWTDLMNILPQKGKYILNKVNTGCGGTTLFLNASKPVILVSPRSNVLYSKSAQFPNSHLYRTEADKNTSPNVLKERLKDYIIRCYNYTVPKILVTVDSYPNVAEQLQYMGILSEFIVLVDEFQCLMSDSKFKGNTDLEFLHNLTGVKSVCYMSATPIDEMYLNMIEDFHDVSDYIKLIWDSSLLDTPNLEMRPYGSKESCVSICKKIIDDYNREKYFAQKMVNGNVVESKEVVFFLNDVKAIKDIIISTNLNPSDVNVMCSNSNRYIPDLKKIGVQIGRLATDFTNPQNCTFTFCTSASFEGVDFYSNSAFTYIFCDGSLNWHRHDLVIDVPQILGRQRLDQNPFRKDAIMYYRPDYRKNADMMLDKIKLKEENTQLWISNFNSSNDTIKKMLIEEVRKRGNNCRYDDDYVEVVDDINGGFAVKENSLVFGVEIRDYYLSEYVYRNSMTILSSITNGTNINVYGNCSDAILNSFYQIFQKSNSFSDRMRHYCEFRKSHPEYDQTLYESTFIDVKYHQYYDRLGSEKLAELGFVEDEISGAMLTPMIVRKIQEVFEYDKPYRLDDVKNALQNIYSSLGIRATAKASDIKKYLPNVVQRQLSNPVTNKRELYLHIK